MSGKPWTPERRAAFSKQMTARWSDPKLREAARERGRAMMADPKRRAEASERMQRLQERMRTNAQLKQKVIRGQKRVRRTKAYRDIQSAVMKDVMSRPENREKARQHACEINRDPEIRQRQWAGRVRNGSIPTPPRAKPKPKLTGDALFLQLLELEARKGARK